MPVGTTPIILEVIKLEFWPPATLTLSIEFGCCADANLISNVETPSAVNCVAVCNTEKYLIVNLQ